MEAAFVRKSRKKPKIEVRNDLIVMVQEKGTKRMEVIFLESKKALTVKENVKASEDGRQSINNVSLPRSAVDGDRKSNSTVYSSTV